ncbi:MAG: hypothetical protein JKY55_13455 [Aliivibrio sp.]|uniref:hypothetical protein n=1 Tax=Aliivibrio sp. TaxID=1872443 RepID=UPI001A568070|nr:hypothetical protein [Aliivibrio sp.]
MFEIINVKDWITIVSVMAVIIGWFINDHLNRKNEIFKKRMDYKLRLYQSYYEVAFLLEKIIQEKSTQEKVDEFVDKLAESQAEFLMLGDAEEISYVNEIVSLAQQNKHVELKNKSAKFISLIRKKWRKEIGLSNID